MSPTSSVLGTELQRESANAPRKLRTACDRCHSQKLQCIKTRSNSSCDRCLRLHTSCQFSPRATRSLFKTPQSSIQDDEPELLLASDITPTWNGITALEDVVIENDIIGLFASDLGIGSMVEQATSHSQLHRDIQSYSDRQLPELSYEQTNTDTSYPYAYAKDIDQGHPRDTYASGVSSSSITNSLGLGQGVQSLVSPVSVTQDLTFLSISLHELFNKLPLQPGVDSSITEAVSAREDPSKASRQLVLDELFCLTNSFLTIIQKCTYEIYKHTCLSEGSQSMSYGTSFMTSQPIAPLAFENGTCMSLLNLADEATMLLIMSCYSRLTEIYISIFKMMQACIEFSAKPRHDRGWSVVLPRVQVGSQSSPSIKVDSDSSLSPTASSMYMMVITMLSAQLCSNVSDAMSIEYKCYNSRPDGGACATKSASDFSSNSRSYFKAMISDRTERLEKTIGTTKTLLQRFSFSSTL